MPTLQWLGALEPRPSPLVQTLNALQPGVDALTEWLRQQPEREQQMLQALSSFLQSLDERQREQFLSTIPRERAAALAEMSQRHGIGGFSLTPKGRLEVAVPIEAQIRQQEWRLRQAQELLSPILGAPEEQRRAWVSSPEGQSTLRRVKQLSPSLVLDRGGMLEPIQNVDVVLQRQLTQAQISKTGAETQETTARAGLYEAQTKVTLKELDRLGAEIDQITANTERIRALTPAEVDNVRASTDKLKQETHNLAAQHPWIGKLAEAEVAERLSAATVNQATGERIRTLTPIEANKLQNDANYTAAQIEQLRYNLDWLKKTEPLLYRRLELQVDTAQEELNELRTRNSRLAEFLQEQLQGLVLDNLTKSESLEQLRKRGPVELEILNNQLKRLNEELTEFIETRPQRYQKLQTDIENAIKQGKLTDAQTALAYAESKLRLAQANNIPIATEIDRVLRERELDIKQAGVLASLFETEVRERIAEADRAAQLEIAKMQHDVERERNIIMRENNLLDHDLGTLQTLVGIDELAALRVIEKRMDLTEEEKQRIEKGIKQKRTREAIALASDTVTQVLSTPAMAAALSEYVKQQKGQFDPFSLILSFAQDIAGDLWDPDAAVEAFSGVIPGTESDEQGSSWTKTLLTFIAGGFAAKWAGKIIGKASDVIKAVVSRLRGKPSGGATSPVVRALQSGPVQEGLPGIGGAQPLPGPAGASGKAVPMGNAPGAVELPEIDPVTGARTVTLPSKLQPGKIAKGTKFVPLQAPLWIPSEEEMVEMGLLPREQYELERQGREALWDYFTTWIKTKLGLAAPEGLERAKQQLSAVLEALTRGNNR